MSQEYNSKIVFVLTHPGLLRMFYTRIQSYLDDGKQVLVFFETIKFLPDSSKFEGQDYMRTLSTLGVEFEELKFKKDGWTRRLKAIALGLDVMFYANKEFQQVDHYVERVFVRLGRAYKVSPVRTLAHFFYKICSLIPSSMLRFALRNLIKIYGHLAPKQILNNFQTKKFDGSTTFFAQYLELSSRQPLILNFLKKRIRFRAVVLIPSWDNLTTKSILKGRYDEVHVWGQFQKDEALKLHLARNSKIKVVGNSSWPILEAEFSLCKKKPIRKTTAKIKILYICSSFFIAPQESEEIIALLNTRTSKDLERCSFHIWEHPQISLRNKSEIGSMKSVRFNRPRNASSQSVGGALISYLEMSKFDVVIGKETSALAEAAMLGCKTFLYNSDLGVDPYHKIHLSTFLPQLNNFSDIHKNTIIDVEAMRAYYGIVEEGAEAFSG